MTPRPEDLSLDELLERYEMRGGFTAESEEMARRLKLVGARHRPVTVVDGSTWCRCGRQSWPCPDAVDLKVEEG